MTMKGAMLEARDFKEDLSEEVTSELRPKAQERHSQAKEESVVGRSGARVFLAGGTARAKAQSDHEFGILKKSKEISIAGQCEQGREGRGLVVGRVVALGSHRSLWATVTSVGFTLRALGSHRELGGRGGSGYDFTV